MLGYSLSATESIVSSAANQRTAFVIVIEHQYIYNILYRNADNFYETVGNFFWLPRSQFSLVAGRGRIGYTERISDCLQQTAGFLCFWDEHFVPLRIFLYFEY